ncbi:MAG TPA: gliding motility lipoprotein GldH [Bacteroidales bacterium]|nr:gliding motility lipoprotein GldH [Bacteroidales bacterium]
MAKLKLLVVAAIAIVICSACSDNYVYNGYVTLPGEQWHADSVATFQILVSDTMTYYNLYVNVRNTTDYPFQNLYLFIDIIAPNGASVRDTLECYLADNHGAWLGKGRGKLRDNRFLYRDNVRFGAEGDYTVTLQQAMRVDQLNGVSEVGFRVELSNQN